jgi:folate-binding protein YgfZ
MERRVPTIVDQYRTIAAGAGWIDRSGRGRLRFEGADVASFLQALVTNDVAGLPIGQGVYATYLTPQGRMISDLEIHRLHDSWLAEVPGAEAAALASRFDSLVFSEDVRVSDVSGATSQIEIMGAEAAEVVAGITGIESRAVAATGDSGHLGWPGGIVVRTGMAFVPGYQLFGLGEGGARERIVEKLDEAGIERVSDGLVDALRIEAGRPLFGVDMSADTIPLEAGLLDRAISTTKGCYVGQEIIIRILHRGGGRVAKRLARLRLDLPDDNKLPAPGAALVRGGQEVGRLTSVATSLTQPGGIALGYVAREAAEIGSQFSIDGRPDVSASLAGFAG